MKFTLSYLAAVAFSLVSADLVDQSQWQAPPPGAVRGPCPAFNTMANYGYLARDGKNIHRDDVVKVFKKFYNLAEETGNFLLDQAFNGGEFHPDNVTFDLNNLGKHNVIEHDVSLVRDDWDRVSAQNSTQHQAVQPKYVEQLGEFINNNILSLQGFADFRRKRYEDSKAKNPNLEYGLENKLNARLALTSFLEAALIVRMFGQNPEMNMNGNGVKTFLGQEKLVPEFVPPQIPMAISPETIGLAIDIATKSGLGPKEQVAYMFTHLK